VQVERVRRYALTKFIILYLVGELVKQTEGGRMLLDNPLPFLQTSTTANEKQGRILHQIRELAHYAVVELNYYVRGHGDEAYDYKSELKSQRRVEALRNEVLRGYEKDVYRDRITPFSLPTN